MIGCWMWFGEADERKAQSECRSTKRAPRRSRMGVPAHGARRCCSARRNILGGWVDDVHGRLLPRMRLMLDAMLSTRPHRVSGEGAEIGVGRDDDGATSRRRTPKSSYGGGSSTSLAPERDDATEDAEDFFESLRLLVKLAPSL